MVSIVDVARRAGVSTATVSAVINEKEWVKDGLRERVQAAIEAVGYRPNFIARSLKSGRSGTIGMLVSDISNPFFASVVQAVSCLSYESDYSIVLASSDEDPEKEASYFSVLVQRMIDGLILAPSSRDRECAEMLSGLNIPVVLLDRAFAPARFDAVVVDNRRGVRDAIEHLTGLGHRRIGFVAGPRNVWTAEDRHQGYLDALAAAAIAYDETLVRWGNFNEDSGYAAAADMIRLGEPPTAIFASNNKMMVGVTLALRDCGLRCPDEVSIASFDDFEWAPAFSPALTVVRQPIAGIAEAVTSLLLSRIKDGSDLPPRTVTLPTELVLRGSTRRLSASPRRGRRAAARD
jgi:LacI family transcriptional regulator